MAQYRGVDKQEILDSITKAVDCLAEMEIGDFTTSVLKRWAPSRIAYLERAETDEQLCSMIPGLGISTFLGRFYEVMKAHAILDPAPAEGAKSKALEAYEGLMKWGAFAEVIRPPIPIYAEILDDVDREASEHRLLYCLDHLSAEDSEPNSQPMERLDKLLTFLDSKGAGDELTLASRLRNLIPGLLAMKEMPKARDRMLATVRKNPADGLFAPLCVAKMLDIDARDQALDVPNPMQRYIVTLGAVPESPKDIQEILRSLINDVGSTLQDFIEKQEARLPFYMAPGQEEATIGFYFAQIEDGRLGVMFYATQEAAQHYANQPGRAVFNRDNQQILPNNPPPVALLPPVPSGGPA